MTVKVKEKVVLDFLTIRTRIERLELPSVDRVVGIATGGTVPASLVAYKLGVPLSFITLNYRAEDNTPQRPEPTLLHPFQAPEGEHVLLVDDVSVTGQTFAVARGFLPNCTVTTLALKGKADFVLFPEVARCVHWPWKPS
jgi:adenine/guanine phosphoribosyltransferase-like PRPP-binding protein